MDTCRFSGGSAAEKKVHHGLFQEELLQADGCRGDNGRICTFSHAFYCRNGATNNDLVLAGCYEECQGGTMSLTACKKNLDDAKAKLDEAKANYQAKRDTTGKASTDP